MTAMATDLPASVPMIPGLDDVGRAVGPSTALERAARSQLAALHAAGRLDAGHSILVALITDLARTVGIGAAQGKAAGTAMAARQLLDALDKLPPLVEPGQADDWAAVVAALGPPSADEPDAGP